MKASIAAAVFAIAVLISAVWASERHSVDRVSVGDVTYDIPKSYNVSSVTPGFLLMTVDATDWGPQAERKVGWEHNIRILIEPQINTVALVYDTQFDGTPTGAGTGGRSEIQEQYRAEPDLTVTVLGGMWSDTVVPDQDLETMPRGFLLCSKYNPPYFPNAHCQYLFDRDGQRWKVSFGRQFLENYEDYHDRAVALLDRFRVEGP